MLQMEVGCQGARGLAPQTQTQVGGTPHKPAQPSPSPSTRHTETRSSVEKITNKTYSSTNPNPNPDSKR